MSATIRQLMDAMSEAQLWQSSMKGRMEQLTGGKNHNHPGKRGSR